ncbi:Voltage-dependent calcium channel type A subunit alpha-1 [Papilio machaon]|uniref:Voltage-dependent calcium channel type A subunit alpha-1 n=1 Tax=Papilio machaon TaxID=76193 RepID=A0A194QNW4_PAPMA|nr:Voltage-dependent calcium channel type A subunit alpha-1 [Papilio machaon]
MLGGVGGRHASVRRRGSSPGVRRHVGTDSPPASPRPPRRRRAALAVSDHKTCALIHTRLKLGDIILIPPRTDRQQSDSVRGQLHGGRVQAAAARRTAVDLGHWVVAATPPPPSPLQRRPPDYTYT